MEYREFMSKRTRKGGVKSRGKAREMTFILAPAILFATSFLLYINTLGHDFVFDDVTLILQNPQVVQLDWLSIIWQGGYRPVRTLTYAVNFALGGENPFGYHLFNVLLHACNVILVFFLAWILSRSKVVAWVAGLTYAVHPLQTAAVAYISGRKDLMAAFFLLLGFLLYLLSRRRTSGGYWKLVFAYFCFILAVLSKEVAIVFPVLLLLIDALLDWRQSQEDGEASPFLPTSVWRSIRRYPIRYCCFLVLGLLATYWLIFINQASRMEGYWGGTVWTNLGTSFKLFAHYLKLALFPSPLIADYLGDVFPVSTGLLELSTVLAAILSLLYFWAALKVFGTNPLLSVAMLWFFLLLLPVLHLVPFHEIAADHFEYLPMVGVALSAGIGFSSLYSRFPMRLLLWSGLCLLVLGSSLLVIQRNRDWKNGETLWAATYNTAPGSYRANANLGEIYFRQGLESGGAGSEKVNDGIRLTQNSIELDPSRSVSWGNLGAMYLTLGQQSRESGDLEKAKEFQRLAIDNFQHALELEPGNAFTESNIGNVYKELGNVYEAEGDEEQALDSRKQAVEWYRRALQTTDQRHEVRLIWLNFGGVFIDAGYYDQATHYLGEFLASYPDDPRGNYWMGYCLSERGDYDEAVTYLEKAVVKKPTIEAWSQLALSYGRSGQLSKGIDGYRRILTVAPDSSETHYQLGLLYRKAGDTGKALSHLNRALSLDPNGVHSTHIKRLLGDGSALGVKITQKEEI